MYKRCFNLLIIFITSILSVSALAQSAPYYKSVKLKKMPLKTQRVFEESFKRLGLERRFVGSQGSDLLGINMLFSDPFFISKIAVKYQVEGSFELGKTYRFDGFDITHIKIEKTKVAILYKNIERSSIEQLKNILKSQTRKTSLLPDIFPNAYADECSRAEIIGGANLQGLGAEVGEGASASMLSKCFSSAGDGLEDATIGLASDAWDGVKNGFSAIGAEAKRLWAAPATRLEVYANFAGKGIDLLWDFGKNLGKMMIDPVAGAKILKEKFGEAGEFFVDIYRNVESLPFASKVDVICNIIGTLGVDVLITALTAGAGGAKLSLSVARLMHRLGKLSKLIGKGVLYSFSAIAKLSGDALYRLEKIIEAGKLDELNLKMSGEACAI